MKKIKILVSAAEVSGDIAGHHLIKELRSIYPDVYVFGMGGEKLREAGADIKLDLRKHGSVGLFEIFRHLPATLKAFFSLKKIMDNQKPDFVLLIDSQGFNMLLAKAAKKRGIKTIYYYPPQEWLWGTEKGLRDVANTIDLIVSVFEDDYRAYKNVGGRAVFYGNPLLDTIQPSLSKEAAKKYFQVENVYPVIALLPGSRSQEIQKLLPILLETAEIIQNDFPGCKFLLPIASPIYTSEITRKIAQLKNKLNFRVSDGLSHDIFNISDLVIAASGTTILEATCLGTPAIMIYKLSSATYFVAKNILKISLPYYSMPNLLLGKCAIPELVQADARPEKIAREAKRILTDPNCVAQMKKDMAEATSKLGSPGAVKKNAAAIAEFIKSC